MGQAILGAFIMAKGSLDVSQANVIGAGIMLRFQLMGGLEWNNYARTAYDSDIDEYECEEHAMCAFIKQDGYGRYLTAENTAIFWHDTTFPDEGVYCCLIISGQYESYPNCITVFGDYIDRSIFPDDPSDAMKEKMAKNAKPADPKQQIPRDAENLVEEGERLEEKGKMKKALDKYRKAYMLKPDNLYLGAKLSIAMLNSGDGKQREKAIDIMTQVGEREPNSLDKGEYHITYAKCLYAYVKDRKEGKLDKKLKADGLTTRMLLSNAIKGARLKGFDDPEFTEMEEALQDKSQSSSFFNRKKK